MFFRPAKRPVFITASVILVGLYAIVVSIVALTGSMGKMLAGEQLLLSAKAHLLTDTNQARSEFTLASESFEEAVSILQDAPWYTKLLTPLPPFRWQIGLTKASHALAESGKTVSDLSESYPAPNLSQPDVSTLLSSVSSSSLSWYDRERARFDYLEKQIETANRELQGVPNWILFKRMGELASLKENVQAIHLRLPQVRTLVAGFRTVSKPDDPTPKHFLILFQNDAELRPSGGFIGSYATITASSGTIRSYTFGTNIYKIDKAYTLTEHLDSPDPPITAHWAFRDSNRGVGFLPEIAPQVSNVFTRETKMPIEGIVFLDSSVLSELLRITGPLKLPGTNVIATADTISDQLTNQIEQEYFKKEENQQENEPKSILNDLIPVLIQSLSTTDKSLAKLSDALGGAVTRKSIQFWGKNKQFNEAIQPLVPLDSPPERGGNWFKVVNSNLGGLKSSTRVKQNVSLTQKVDIWRRKLVQTVTVTRTHTGNGVWPDGENKNFMEIYLPYEAEIERLPDQRGGMDDLPEDLQRELGVLKRRWQVVVETEPTQVAQLKDPTIPRLSWKRVGFWATTSVGEETSYTVRYTLPLTLTNQNRFTYLKQAGGSNESLSVWDKSYEVTSNLSLSK